MQQISNCELELMKIIWGSKGKALYADLVKALVEKGTPWTKNTIITLCSRLVDKGFLKTNKIGRRNEYTSVISEAEYQATQTQDFLEKIYEGDAKGLVATLLQKDLLSCEEYEDLKRHWERGGGSK
ncbi:BlaI/MecI/CopY family transcriptional regulator [Enterocloster citroniae]|uniref:BlaI/MecI/CopY family transcriptional regulator n=1 Tax=Enterocloster citroniae TaxID=358743 RepID=UPI001D05DA1E|nr:BlaI/MecI/CopY family transcriptional regulator [Enterocloster citroniae]MCB7063741.1 BlaI/MecI/CopY family transcriptional regulator [Enterocloster citroniae]